MGRIMLATSANTDEEYGGTTIDGWTLVDSKTGTTAIALPNDFKELLVEVSDGQWVNFTINIAKDMLSNNTKYYSCGAFFSNNSYNSTIIGANLSAVNLNNLTESGTTKTNDGVISVYYR